MCSTMRLTRPCERRGIFTGGAAKRRLAVLAVVVLLFSCREKAARSPVPGDSRSDSASLIFASMQEVKDIRVGSIHNRIMGLEGEIPSGPVSADTVTLGALKQSLDVRLTGETRIDEGVRITASGGDGTEYSTHVERDSISVAGHDETVFGYYFSVPFENKPWSHSLNWRLKVYAGKTPVIEKELAIPLKDFIIYAKTSDDPFDVIDIARLVRGQTYKLFYPNLHSDLLIAYYTSDYSSYVPVYVGQADPVRDAHSVPEITISALARQGSYFFTHKARSAVSRDDENLPVFGFRLID
jgi:hypothetical protein